MELQVKRKKRPSSIQKEIARRAQNSDKLAALQAQRNAIGEILVERLDEIIALMQAAGFSVSRFAPTMPAAPPVSPPFPQAPQVAAPPPPAIKNPCALCGQEATHTLDMPDGTKQFLCRPHAMVKLKERQEEQTAQSLLGTTGTNFQRKAPAAQNPNKVIIHHDAPEAPDMLKGHFPNGGEPPTNNVLE